MCSISPACRGWQQTGVVARIGYDNVIVTMKDLLSSSAAARLRGTPGNASDRYVTRVRGRDPGVDGDLKRRARDAPVQGPPVDMRRKPW
jgi:hypothetical protein